jgi:hypothetical protein
MRFSSLLLLLPALAAADQIPLRDQLKGWFEKAKAYMPSSPSSPLDAGAAKVAAANVVSLTKENWSSELSRKPGASVTGPVEWMVLISGGNKTCWGNCAGVEKAWNVGFQLFFLLDCRSDSYRNPLPSSQLTLPHPILATLIATTKQSSVRSGLQVLRLCIISNSPSQLRISPTQLLLFTLCT